MEDDPHVPYRSLAAASLALLIHSMLTAVALAAWFARAIEPWTWNSVLATVSCVLGVIASAIVWRFPSRPTLVVGLAVMLSSLLRLGAVSEWTWASFTMLAVTALLLVPLVHALVLLPPSS